MIEDDINSALENEVNGEPSPNTFICLTGDGKMLSVLIENGLVFYYYPLGFPDDKRRSIVLSNHSKILQCPEEDFIRTDLLRKIFEKMQLNYLNKK